MDDILVTGATGTTGRTLLDALAARGVRARAMVRRAEAGRDLAGVADAVLADFDDERSLAAALHGVRRAYLVTPSSHSAERQQVRFVELAAANGLEQVVLLSQLGADEDSPVRYLRYHAAVERRVRELGLGHTFLRPNLYLQALLGFRESIVGEGRFYAAIGDARVSAIDVRDIAAVAAVALTENGHLGRTYTLTGPSPVTHAEIAAALGAAIGRPVTFVDVPKEVFADGLRQVLPPWQVAGTLEDYDHYRRGEAAFVTSDVADVTGHAPRDVATFARDHAAVLLGDGAPDTTAGGR
jgi:uncharacterized protein YbjT (DUF2867 family)